MTDIQLICIAAAGGFVIQLLNLLELPKLKKEERPNFHDWVYYIPYLINPILGAFLAFIYLSSNTHLNSILALHIGASAPVLLRTMVSTLPRLL